MNDAEKKKTMPMCQSWQLNKPLEGDLKTQFQNLFLGEHAWRLRVDGTDTALLFKDRLGIDINHPTLRDAVAVDLVKLDDKSVSNDYISTTSEHIYWSYPEHERWMLNRNFRIHLVNLENEWSEVQYDDGVVETKRTVEREYQGPRMSRTLLKYFQDLFNHHFSDGSEEVYVPFTNANDFINEIALIPNTHPDFRSISSRAYYDTMYNLYKSRLEEFGISSVATFALVDPDKDKTHSGEWLVKVQRRSGDAYQYIVAKIDVEGQVKEIMSHWQSERNEILSVCEDDFKRGRASSQRPVDGVEFGEREVPMVHSTTSSHYSVFRQRIPEYDLREVRHYLQFKTRLEGMELMLKILKMNIYRKEVQASDCFARETVCISRLFEEIRRNEPLMDLMKQYFNCVDEHDSIYTRLVALREMRAEKTAALDGLVAEYNSLSSSLSEQSSKAPDVNLDRKIGLGQTIKTMRLEIDRTLDKEIRGLENRLADIEDEVDEINRKAEEMQREVGIDQEALLHELEQMMGEGGDWSKEKEAIYEKADELAPSEIDSSIVDGLVQTGQELGQELQTWGTVADLVMQDTAKQNGLALQARGGEVADSEWNVQPLASLDFSTLHRLMVMSERWKDYMLSMGYELHQLNRMLTMCEDATIKVRRLVHNFKERMERTEEDVWDESHQLRPDFNFKAIAAASLKDIILLHDWYACNAPQKTHDEMGFSSEEEFMQFRRRCNTISYNLRKNQYAQLLAVDRHRIEETILDIKSKIADYDSLHWKDKYGWEAKKERDAQEDQEKEWSLADVDSAQAQRIHGDLFHAADKILAQKEMDERQYRKDAELMRSRTLAYLKDVGVAEGEEELERLATMNRTAQFKGDVNAEMRKVEDAKRELDKAKSRMERQRNALKDIISQTTDAERKVQSLEMENSRIFDICVRERSRLARNRLLLKKIENETKIAEIRATVKEMKKGRLSDFSDLERMRRDVDRAQAEYDSRVKEFKQTIGSDKDAIESMIVGIYNRFQNEILNGGRK